MITIDENSDIRFMQSVRPVDLSTARWLIYGKDHWLLIGGAGEEHWYQVGEKDRALPVGLPDSFRVIDAPFIPIPQLISSILPNWFTSSINTD